MIEKTIQLFTENEEGFVNLLIRIGTKQTIAKALVFPANAREATSVEIERGINLRQPEVSMTIKYMAETRRDQKQ